MQKKIKWNIMNFLLLKIEIRYIVCLIKLLKNNLRLLVLFNKCWKMKKRLFNIKKIVENVTYFKLFIILFF